MANETPGQPGEQDLTLEKLVDATPEQIWKVWSDPEKLRQWWCPKPWSVSRCEMDFRAGGRFLTVMRSPEGKDMPAEEGCFLEVVPHERIIFTDALSGGYRPTAEAFMTGIIELEPRGQQTLYKVRVLHKSAEDCEKHNAMGFHDGWGAAIDQMADLAREQ